VGAQPISPGAVVSRIWEIYRDQLGVLLGTAVVLYALQFIIYLLLSSTAGIALVLLFWFLSILYQGMVVRAYLNKGMTPICCQVIRVKQNFSSARWFSGFLDQRMSSAR